MVFDIDRLSIPAKAEAMRYGHVAVLNIDELIKFLDNALLEENEHFSVVPLTSIAGEISLYSVRIVPVVRIKSFQ